MIARPGGWVLGEMARRRRRAIEHASRHAAKVQTETLLRLVRRARSTRFGRAHDFASIRSIEDYQANVPVREYLDFRPLWHAALDGDCDVTWPGRTRHWVKTSGTTAGDKVIPVTPAALRSHRRGGWDALLLAVERVGGRRLLDGKLLFLGGSSRLVPVGVDGLAGDLSGLVVRQLPAGLRSRYSPGPVIAAMPDWETRLAAVARSVADQDIRLIAGMPSWMTILIEEVARVRQARGRPLRTMAECWPNLEVFIHGGVSLAPYRTVLLEWLGRPIHCIELYPASEGFVGLQTELTGGLTLMVDYGIFYEFIPVEDLGLPRPRRHTVDQVKLDRQYAIALTTPAGLWSYLLGDTIRFVARDPLRLEITGRNRHFVNAFGENVIVEEVERALMEAAREVRAEVAEFTVAPVYPSPGASRGRHEWLIEFRVTPTDRARFRRSLDEALQRLNTDYRTKRTGDVGMLDPTIVELPAGTFHRWLRSIGKLGNQHKVPRVTNSRDVADALLALATPTLPEPAPPVSVP